MPLPTYSPRFYPAISPALLPELEKMLALWDWHRSGRPIAQNLPVESDGRSLT